ncbi:MAG: hypothetical protein QM648_05700 [Solirubrobacterales bacterium]
MTAPRLALRAATAACALLLICFCSSAFAYPFGTPDTTFGTGGAINFKPPSSAYGAINSIATQADGKILATGAGESSYPGWIARFNSNGGLDTSFNGTGVYGFLSGGFEDPTLQAVAVQPDGKIVVAGAIENTGSGVWWRLIARLNSDGSLDTATDSTPSTCFGSGCIGYTISVASGNANLSDVEVLPDGDILVAGDHTSGGSRLDVLRYDSGGSLDTAFTNNASADTSALSLASGDPIRVRILQPADGTFVIAYGSSSGKFSATKLLANGHVDTGFGNNGTWGVGASILFNDAVLRPDGRILFVGGGSLLSQNTAIGGIDASGETDGTIGDGGIATATPVAGERSSGMSIRVLSDGRFVVAGLGFTPTDYPYVTSLVFKPDGKLDPSYGADGVRLHPELGTYVYPMDLELLPGDKPLIAGTLFDIPAITNYGFITKLHGPNDPGPPIATSTKIAKPSKSKNKASKLMKFSGTATPVGQVAKVEVAIQRIDSKLLKKKKQCLWLSSNKAKFKKVKAVKKRCAAPKWLKATGTASWSYKLKKKLARGSYVLQVRATATDGTVQAKPTTKKFKIS